MHSEITKIEDKFVKKDIPEFSPGDVVAVHFIVREGDRERVQVFEGVVLRRRGGGLRKTFTTRKVSFGIGVEKTFPLHSPLIKKIEVLKKGRVRRANLSYLRDKANK
ncbi:50S ribosomal protein L19 [Candidatus Aerophobetes bacterium]|nr:50S ribosomal protein L19 [Candidatus Aerophobetes bacterium]